MLKVQIYVKKQNSEEFSRKGAILLDMNYTDATSYLEFTLKAKYIPISNFKNLHIANAWFNDKTEKLYSIVEVI